MDHKTFLKNKSICTLPWSGFQLEPSGHVKNCVISKDKLGDINQTKIENILHGPVNAKLKKDMLKDKMPANCAGCHLQERNRSNLSSISSRLYYHKELGTKVPMDFYDDVKNFSLKHVDLRWTNSCNQACVYCAPESSSKWAKELGVKIKSNTHDRNLVKDFVFNNIAGLENVYLAGGEPMLMKENFEFLKLLREKNPNCNIRVNTNLSTTNTGIFDLLCDFKNVHWIISVETIEQEYEYIRHHGSWVDFQTNLQTIKKLDHKISFNMLHFLLNYESLFECIDYLKSSGFHDNSFIAGPLFTPAEMNLLNLPWQMLDRVLKKISDRVAGKPHGYLKNSYENLLEYYQNTPWKKDIRTFMTETKKRDMRRGTDCRNTFPRLFEELYAHAVE
jgi:MoaA/NifB/PqqE/SkfB family radical SAM enzyme